MDRSRRIAGEAVGTALLLAAVVGSGIMAERLAGGSVGLALLANTLATGAALVALILALGSVSGAHFNPVVTLASASRGRLPWIDVPGYVAAQIAGALAGVALANAMFELPLAFASGKAREGAAQLLSEAVATFGLVLVVERVGGRGVGPAAAAVGAWITAAYWFTASTSFANPAVTLARAASDTFAGIRPSDVPGFVAAQVVGGAAAAAFAHWIGRPERERGPAG
jgi:glycerol uptake facilitator-like aquaporin